MRVGFATAVATPDDDIGGSSALLNAPELGVDGRVSGEVDDIKWKIDVKATSLWAGCILCVVALLVCLIWLEPLSNPTHFVLTLFVCYIAGNLSNAGVNHQMVRSLKEQIQSYRKELNEVAKRKALFEERFLENRISSKPEKPAKKKSRRKDR